MAENPKAPEENQNPSEDKNNKSSKKKTMKVLFKKSPSRAPYFLAYHVGDVGVVDFEKAKAMIGEGICEQA